MCYAMLISIVLNHVENFIHTIPEFLFASPTALHSTILSQLDSAVVNQYTSTNFTRADSIVIPQVIQSRQYILTQSISQFQNASVSLC